MQKKLNNMRVVKKSDGFTIVSNTLIRDSNLSLKARGLLIFMLQLPEDWVFTESGLCKVTGEGSYSIRSGLKELMDHKYLYRLQTKNENGSFGNMIYYLFDEPTQMMLDNQNINESESDELNENISTFNIDKNHPDYSFINGGWMNE